jgi:hypothetical protein
MKMRPSLPWNRCLAVLAVLATAFATPLPATEMAGRWEGGFINPPKENGYAFRYPRLCAELVALGGGRYRLRFLPEFFRRAEVLFETEIAVEAGKSRFSGQAWSGSLEPDALRGTAFADTPHPVEFELRPSAFRPPTLGAPAPEGARVLFDGTDLKAWRANGRDAPADWRIMPDGVMEVVTRGESKERGGDIRTVDEFGDARLHLEFRLPPQPKDRGQARANSGVFLQGLYEVQILDSFGLDGLWNECGALYRLSPPKVNACLPPGEWQAYDIDFRAARFASDGTVAEPPRMTVRHNGVVIHRDEELTSATNVAGSNLPSSPPPLRGPLVLQDHGNVVQFRNIWILPVER